MQLTQIDVDMVIIEYDPDGTDRKLDFATFENDFTQH